MALELDVTLDKKITRSSALGVPETSVLELAAG